MVLSSTRFERNRGPREAVPIDASVAVLDFGSQLTGNIDRMTRETSIRSEIVPHDIAYEALADHVQAVMYAGGPDSVFQRKAPHPDERILSMEVPAMGICYGMGLIVEHYGGKMERLARREDGKRTISHNDNTIFAGTPEEQVVWMSHGDSLTDIPSGFEVIAWSDDIPAAIANYDKKIFGVQFHPEADNTVYGKQIMSNFLLHVAGLKPDFTIVDQIAEAKAILLETLHSGREALIALSGGVDSSVGTKLIQSLGIPYKAFHIDHGCMRKGESASVLRALESAGVEVTVVDAADEFFNATSTIKGRFGLRRKIGPLKDVTDPEHKRIIMGDTFIDVFGRLIDEEGMKHDTILVQGSIRPDKIESGVTSKKSDKIKTHHNASPAAVALIKAGKVSEPLQHLYKDQVRKVGAELGLPEELVNRQPFPGPGLAIRILCDTPLGRRESHKLAKLQEQLDDFLPVSIRGKVLRQKLVGVQGDARTYKPTVALPDSVAWKDAMELAHEIPAHIHGINRVIKLIHVVEIGDPLSATPTRVNPETVQILQEADYITNTLMTKSGESRHVSQFPVMLSYLNFGKIGTRTSILRPFITKDFMTGRPAEPGSDISEGIIHAIATQIVHNVRNIQVVGLDCSTKPPGTTEGE